MVICALFWSKKSKKWRISAGLRVFFARCGDFLHKICPGWGTKVRIVVGLFSVWDTGARGQSGCWAWYFFVA